MLFKDSILTFRLVNALSRFFVFIVSFFNEAGRLSADFIPSKRDIVRVRIRTTGIDETILNWDGFTFTYVPVFPFRPPNRALHGLIVGCSYLCCVSLVDVGGQRTERKWMHMFEGKVDAVIFCVSMADYDLNLREDGVTNRMRESLELFQETCRNPFFSKLYVFLLLNKMDLFEEKIKVKDPKDYGFDDYTGGKDKEAAKRYFAGKFKACHADHSKLFVNDSIAVRSSKVKFVFESIRAEILRDILDTAVYI